MARLTALIVVFPETEHQAWNEDGRFVLTVCGDDGEKGRLGREARRR